MKIFFDGVNWQSASGPNSFAQRLATQLSLHGHTPADSDDYDVALVFIEETGRADPRKPKVQRLDGIWFKPSDFERKNTRIKACYETSDAVIFQSDFDRQMVTKWWGDPKSGHVIKNGIQIERIESNNETLLELKQRYSKVFVCSANWHRQKRLKENIELFKHLRATQFPYSCLIVMGASPDCMVADANIYYTGPVPHEKCLEMYKAADWMIHLAWADHSPNVVCEALSQNCPVICSETGGTKELVGPYGIVLSESHKYDFELFDYENPPPIDVSQVKTLPDITVDPFTVDIGPVAQRYIEVFEAVLSKR
jgi:glycosyltransferase involved in cell wall biosynthesis